MSTGYSASNGGSERRRISLRLDPAVHEALAQWAGDELRSTNAQIEFLLRRALDSADRYAAPAGPTPQDTQGRAERDSGGEATPGTPAN